MKFLTFVDICRWPGGALLRQTDTSGDHQLGQPPQRRLRQVLRTGSPGPQRTLWQREAYNIIVRGRQR